MAPVLNSTQTQTLGYPMSEGLAMPFPGAALCATGVDLAQVVPSQRGHEGVAPIATVTKPTTGLVPAIAHARTVDALNHLSAYSGRVT